MAPLRDRDVTLRWLYTALPALWCLFLIEVAGGILRAPQMTWNEIRLSRSMAVLDGFPLYPGERELGPVIGTLHTPLSHYLFLPAAAIRDPTASIVAGSLLACVVMFSALGFALIRSAAATDGRWGIASICFLFCGFLIIQSEGAFNTAFSIHADAPALAFATIACSIAGSRTSSVWMAAAACVLAVASKQTIAPVVLAIALYVGITQGGKRLALFLLACSMMGGSLLAFLLLALPARAFLFNTLVLAAHRPLKPGYFEILVGAYRVGRFEALPALLPLLFLGIWTWVAEPRREIRPFLAANPWSVFAMAGLALIPSSIKALLTVGADVNHLGFVLYFLFVAAAMAVQQYFSAANQALRFSSRLFVTIGILVGMAPGMALSVYAGVWSFRANPSETAHAYNSSHPGVVYFPYNPMTSLLIEGKPYHLDTALYDREVAGYPLTPEQLESGLPRGFNLVGVPPGQEIQSKALQGLLASFVRITDPALPGWTVYRRAL